MGCPGPLLPSPYLSQLPLWLLLSYLLKTGLTIASALTLDSLITLQPYHSTRSAQHSNLGSMLFSTATTTELRFWVAQCQFQHGRDLRTTAQGFIDSYQLCRLHPGMTTLICLTQFVNCQLHLVMDAHSCNRHNLLNIIIATVKHWV